MFENEIAWVLKRLMKKTWRSRKTHFLKKRFQCWVHDSITESYYEDPER